MSLHTADESRPASNIESLQAARDVGYNDPVITIGAVTNTLRTLAPSNDSLRLPTQVHNDTALDMTTKKTPPKLEFPTPVKQEFPTAPIKPQDFISIKPEFPTWGGSVPSFVTDTLSSPSLNVVSRCSSVSVGENLEEAELAKEKRPKPTNNHKKSYVWRHFRHPQKNSFFSEDDSIVKEEDKSKTECIHCGAILAFNQSGTTTTMLNHLKSRHGDITAVEEEKRREERQVNGSPKNKALKANKPVKVRKKTPTSHASAIALKIKNSPNHFLADPGSLPMALNLSTSTERTASGDVTPELGPYFILKIASQIGINNNISINSLNNNGTHHHVSDQQTNPEIPSPISDGQASGRASIGTAESSSALMVASPGSAGSDSTGPRRVKKRKRTASADSQGLTGPSPSSGAASPHRGGEWDGLASPHCHAPVTTGRLLSYIVKDLNPPEALDSENFQNLLPGVKTCSSDELRASVMPSRMFELQQQLKQSLAAPETTCAVAVECWDHHGALMASVGTQFLNQSGPCFRMLKTQEYCESVPLSKILSCLSYYDLTKASFLPIVSNEAQTLRDELEHIQPDNAHHTVVLPCFTTILNKVLNDAVSYCAPIADLTPKLMDFAKPRMLQSEKWLYYYDAVVRVNKELSLKGDALLENQTAFTGPDIALMKSLTPILVQLFDLSRKFNALEPTASVVLPLVRHLVGSVLLPDEKKDGKVIAMFKASAREQLEHNFLTNAKVTDTLALSTLLDPRHKHNPLFEEDEGLRRRTMAQLRRLVAEEDQSRSEHDQSPASKRARHEDDLSAVFGQECGERACQVTSYTNASAYALSAGSTNLQVMDWWRAHRDDFPTVARIAMRYFVIPANCAPASIFSPAGPMAYRSRRALLQREDMNSLLFLHHNL